MEMTGADTMDPDVSMCQPQYSPHGFQAREHVFTFAWMLCNKCCGVGSGGAA